MANRREFGTVVVVGILAVLVASVGLYLGFHSDRLKANLPPPPPQPDQGPIVYEMRSMRSDPDRVRFEWREVARADAYRVTVMTAEDDSLFTSPEIHTTYWTIPPEQRGALAPGKVYHWRLTIRFPDRAPAVSDPAAFATQIPAGSPSKSPPTAPRRSVAPARIPPPDGHFQRHP
jgi:hypothetical protein